MDRSCDPGKDRHVLSLASGRYVNQLLIRIILGFIDLDQRILRNGKISQFRRDGDDILHAPSLHDHLSLVFICRIDDLLYAVHIRCKCGDDHPVIPVLIENVVKGLSHRALGRCKAFACHICRIRHQRKDPCLTQLRKTLQIDDPAEDRCVIHLEIPGVYKNTCRCCDRQGSGICDGMIRPDEFHTDRSELHRLAIAHNMALNII